MGLELEFNEDDFLGDLKSEIDMGLREIVEKAITDAIGPDGLAQLTITYDDSGPDGVGAAHRRTGGSENQSP